MAHAIAFDTLAKNKIDCKYCLILISILFSISIFAQPVNSLSPDNASLGHFLTVSISGQHTNFTQGSGTLTTVTPDSASQGQSLTVSISGQNTNFSQGSGTFSVWFNQGSATINSAFFNVSNDTLLDAWFAIPTNAQTGFWDVNVFDDFDGILTKTNGFYIIAKPTPLIIAVSPDTAYKGDSLWVSISGQNTNFTQGSFSVWFNQDSATINSTFFNVSNDTLLDALFAIPTNAQTGFWDVNVFDNLDGIVTLTNGFNILCNTITGAIIGSVNVSENTIENYSVPYNSGSIYNWSVTGGNLVSGNLTDSINIQWGTTGIGLITAVETDSMGCIGNTVSLSVNIGFIGLNENEPGLHTVHVYPNPIRNKLTITFPYKNTLYFVNIYDIYGKEVVRKITPIFNSNTYDLDLSQQKNGVYFVKITDYKNLTIIKKIILE
ncbi:MAG: T9SS type A sorting domain-containing protein [Cytophagales bacterium]|nr:T9SS type A sorting domain-containing protein [Cytophagales bacterium]